MSIAGKLSQMFDFQHFEKNKRLQALIDETEKRYGNALTDADLEFVSAAGEKTADPNGKKDGERDG